MSGSPESEVVFEHNGKPYTLKFTSRNIVKLERELKQPWGAILGQADFYSTRGLILWVALQPHHSSITQDQALDLMDEIGQNKAVTLISETWKASRANPSNDEAPTENPPQPVN